MGLCWWSRPEALIVHSKLDLKRIFLWQAVRIGIEVWKSFPELTSCRAKAFGFRNDPFTVQYQSHKKSKLPPADSLVNQQSLLSTAARKFLPVRPRQYQVQHQAPHSPRHSACRTDIPWVVRNLSIKSFGYRNGTLPPLHPRHIPAFSSYIEDEG